MVKICVGSKNPVKIVSVENAIRKIWPDARIQESGYLDF